jgi:putative SOS response-associated peptidase YedK
VIRQHRKQPVRQLSLMKWGLIPHWTNDPAIAMSTINAKSETAATKPAFRDPIRLRRCLIPADGFYEWKRAGTSRQPYCFEVREGELFAFAGIWDGWRNPQGEWIKTCSILTTTPNAVTASIHDRMPVILDPTKYDRWLDPGMQSLPEVCALLKPCDAGTMRCYPVSFRVNHVGHDDEECSRPVEVAQNRLFA